MNINQIYIIFIRWYGFKVNKEININLRYYCSNMNKCDITPKKHIIYRKMFCIFELPVLLGSSHYKWEKKNKKNKNKVDMSHFVWCWEISIMNGIEINHEFVVAYEWIEIKSTNHQNTWYDMNYMIYFMQFKDTPL